MVSPGYLYDSTRAIGVSLRRRSNGWDILSFWCDPIIMYSVLCTLRPRPLAWIQFEMDARSLFSRSSIFYLNHAVELNNELVKHFSSILRLTSLILNLSQQINPKGGKGGAVSRNPHPQDFPNVYNQKLTFGIQTALVNLFCPISLFRNGMFILFDRPQKIWVLYDFLL